MKPSIRRCDAGSSGCLTAARAPSERAAIGATRGSTCARQRAATRCAHVATEKTTARKAIRSGTRRRGFGDGGARRRMHQCDGNDRSTRCGGDASRGRRQKAREAEKRGEQRCRMIGRAAHHALRPARCRLMVHGTGGVVAERARALDGTVDRCGRERERRDRQRRRLAREPDRGNRDSKATHACHERITLNLVEDSVKRTVATKTRLSVHAVRNGFFTASVEGSCRTRLTRGADAR